VLKYLIYVNGEEKPFHTFESIYEFLRNKNLGNVLFVKKDGKIHSLTITQINTHIISEGEHFIRLDCKFNKLFS